MCIRDRGTATWPWHGLAWPWHGHGHPVLVYMSSYSPYGGVSNVQYYYLYRSEGIPLRDMLSLGALGMGPGWPGKIIPSSSPFCNFLVTSSRIPFVREWGPYKRWGAVQHAIWKRIPLRVYLVSKNIDHFVSQSVLFAFLLLFFPIISNASRVISPTSQNKYNFLKRSQNGLPYS